MTTDLLTDNDSNLDVNTRQGGHRIQGGVYQDVS